MSYNLRLPKHEELKLGKNDEILRKMEEDALENAEAALEKADKPQKVKQPTQTPTPLKKQYSALFKRLNPTLSKSPKPDPLKLPTLKLNRPIPTPLNRSSSSAAATENAKKLVLAGKIAISSKPHEKVTFKRPKLEKKLPSGSVPGNCLGLGGTAAAGTQSSSPKRYGEGGGGRHSQVTISTTPKPIPITHDNCEVPRRSFTIPQLDTSYLEVPKRGPTIYVCAKEYGLTKDMLRILFGRFGRIVAVKLTRNIGVAFVTFATAENAENAVTQMNGTIHNGVQFEIEFAWRQPSMSSNSQHETAKSSPWSSMSSSNQSDKRSWDYKRRQVVYDDDEI